MLVSKSSWAGCSIRPSQHVRIDLSLDVRCCLQVKSALVYVELRTILVCDMKSIRKNNAGVALIHGFNARLDTGAL